MSATTDDIAPPPLQILVSAGVFPAPGEQSFRLKLSTRGAISPQVRRQAVKFACRNLPGLNRAGQTFGRETQKRGHQTMSAVRAEAPLAPEFEGEIREFIRRDVAHLRRPQPEGPAADAVNNLNSLLDRVSGSSVQEIDELIRD